jgi:hypothetical protein
MAKKRKGLTGVELYCVAVWIYFRVTLFERRLKKQRRRERAATRRLGRAVGTMSRFRVVVVVLAQGSRFHLLHRFVSWIPPPSRSVQVETIQFNPYHISESAWESKDGAAIAVGDLFRHLVDCSCGKLPFGDAGRRSMVEGFGRWIRYWLAWPTPATCSYPRPNAQSMQSVRAALARFTPRGVARLFVFYVMIFALCLK